MKSRTLAVVGSALLLAGSAPSLFGQTKEAKPPSLYQRLGGYDGLAAVFDDFAPRLFRDPQFAAFFSGHSTDSNVRQRQRVLELLCQDTGGPCAYTGRPLKQAHDGLPVSDAHWNAFLQHFGASLDQLKVGAKEKGELIALVERYRSDVVPKPVK
jgi:hemoglobin